MDDAFLSPVGTDVEREVSVRGGKPVRAFVHSGGFRADVEYQRFGRAKALAANVPDDIIVWDLTFPFETKDIVRQARCAASLDVLESNPHILALYVRRSSGLNALSLRASPRDHHQTRYS